jgi:hypothetical protein
LRANGSRECAPGDERNCARTVMTGSAKQSILSSCGAMNCFAALAMTRIVRRQMHQKEKRAERRASLSVPE